MITTSNIFRDHTFVLIQDRLTPNLSTDLLPTAGLVNGVEGLHKDLNKWQMDDAHRADYYPKRSNTMDSTKSDISTRLNGSFDDAGPSSNPLKEVFQARPGYTAWVSQAVSLNCIPFSQLLLGHVPFGPNSRGDGQY